MKEPKEKHAMKYGLVLPLSGIEGDVEQLVEYAHIAEEEGWEGVFLEDYIIYWGAQGVTYDPWLTLTAMALRTQRVHLGTTVTPLPSRLPWKLAREAVTLDHLSGGRLALGVGLGNLNDPGFGRVGEVTDARQRGAMLDEALDVLAGLWTGEPFSYQGRHYRVGETVGGDDPMAAGALVLGLAATGAFRRALEPSPLAAVDVLRAIGP